MKLDRGEVGWVDDMASQILWAKSFLNHQKYNVKSKTFYEDNKSSILLETNGHWSKGKRSRHIAVRYFFIKDRVDNGELRIEWCAAENMYADYLTKPLQSEKFFEFRRFILNC